jgi:hypothetical protein
VKRRALLAALGITTPIATAGCLGSIADRLDRTVQLGWFGVHNFDTDPHEFDLRVERDGEVVHESAHEVAGFDGPVVHGAVADCTWGDEPGGYTVSARLDGGEWASRAISEIDELYENDLDCTTAEVQYRRESTRIHFQPGCDRVDDYGGCGFAERGETEDGLVSADSEAPTVYEGWAIGSDQKDVGRNNRRGRGERRGRGNRRRARRPRGTSRRGDPDWPSVHHRQIGVR